MATTPTAPASGPTTLQKIFQSIMQKIAGAVVVAESIFAQAFGLVPPAFLELAVLG